MGMSAGYYLSRQGVQTLLIDAFNPPHTGGSHHGETRLMRHAYAGNPLYTKLAIRADQLWRQLEETGGQKLLHRTGVLNMGDQGALSLQQKREQAQTHGLRVELLNAEEIRHRWKGIQIPDSVQGIYEPNAGYLLSEACIQSFRTQAVAHGALVVPNTPVKDIQIESDCVKVFTDSGDFCAGKLIVSLGAWFGSVAGFQQLPIRSVRKAVAWFEADEQLYSAERFPGFTFGDAQGGYYGFPSINGSGVKIGRHDAGQTWIPSSPFYPFGHYPEDEADLRRALSTYLPLAAGRIVRSGVCKYEMTPDENFIIDQHPKHRHIFLAGGFSGHGFKFSSVVGEILADWVTKGKAKCDLSPFALKRFTTGATEVPH
ncbi:N-methyl-L-tryptophan oxidase [Brevibacillus fluminis]|uniref:N-methyl-L-tryptophan oxidase n=2 Tax=Brevibacillus fluminis TaxID=511487 RepID=A0A3M8DAB1_9BACL|nr:N-methyl-L-tryptophan oxidase [Brevibacillus fluminis]